MRKFISDLFADLRQHSMNAFRQLTSGRQAGMLTISEVLSLYMIEMLNGPTLKSYAEAMGISQPNATYKINSLVEKGYVEKRPSAHDGREMNLITTKKAKKLIRDEELTAEQLELGLRQRFSEEQLNTASEVFQAVMELMDKQ